MLLHGYGPRRRSKGMVLMRETNSNVVFRSFSEMPGVAFLALAILLSSAALGLPGCGPKEKIYGVETTKNGPTLKTADFAFSKYESPTRRQDDAGWSFQYQDESFQFQCGRYDPGDFVWAADGQSILHRGTYGEITRIDVNSGRRVLRTKMPNYQNEIYPSAAGLVVLFRDTAREGKEPAGLLLLDDQTLEIRKWFPLSIMGVATSIENEFAAIAVRPKLTTRPEQQDHTNRNIVPEAGHLLLVNLLTGEITARGLLKSRTLNAGHRPQHFSRPNQLSMHMGITPDSKWIFTDGPLSLIRYQVSGTSIQPIKEFRLASRVDRSESAGASYDPRGDFVLVLGCSNDYVQTNLGTVKTQDPSVIIDLDVTAIAPRDWVFWQSEDARGIDHPNGKTRYVLDRNLKTSELTSLTTYHESPAPSVDLPMFFVSRQNTLVVAKPLVPFRNQVSCDQRALRERLMLWPSLDPDRPLAANAETKSGVGGIKFHQSNSSKR